MKEKQRCLHSSFITTLFFSLLYFKVLLCNSKGLSYPMCACTLFSFSVLFLIAFLFLSNTFFLCINAKSTTTGIATSFASSSGTSSSREWYGWTARMIRNTVLIRFSQEKAVLRIVTHRRLPAVTSNYYLLSSVQQCVI